MHRSQIAGPSRVARDEHRPLAGAPTDDPGGLAGTLQPYRPSVGDYLGRPGADPHPAQCTSRNRKVTYQSQAANRRFLRRRPEQRSPSELRRARADRLRGQIAFSSSRGSDAPALLLKGARQFEPFDPRLARETYLDALAPA